MLLRTAFLGLSLALFACTAAHSSGDSSEDAVTLHPSGPGGDVTLTLTVPNSVWPAHYFYNGIELQPNVATSLPYFASSSGRVPISITVGTKDGQTLKAELDVPIAIGSNTVALGAMRLTHAVPTADHVIILDPAPRSGILDFVDGERSYEMWKLAQGGAPSMDVYAGEPIVPTFVGHYAFNGSSGTDVGFDVAAGQTVDANMKEDLQFSTVVMRPDPTPAQFPNGIPNQTFPVRCVYDSPVSEQGAMVGQTVGVFARKPANCTWGYGAVSVSFTLAPNSVYDAQLKHLDVDDVDLTDQPGQKAAGTYVVQLPNGTRITDSLPTKTGVDLPPGTYEVTTTYAGVDGFKHTTSSAITL